MIPPRRFGADGDDTFQILWGDGEHIFCRGEHPGKLIVVPAAEHLSSVCHERLAREYALKDELDGAWALRPLNTVGKEHTHGA